MHASLKCREGGKEGGKQGVMDRRTGGRTNGDKCPGFRSIPCQVQKIIWRVLKLTDVAQCNSGEVKIKTMLASSLHLGDSHLLQGSPSSCRVSRLYKAGL